MSETAIMTDEGAVARALDDYYAAFSTLDPQAILPCFHEPSMLVGPQGVFAATTRADLPALFKPTMEGMRARGFGRTVLRRQDLKILSPTTAYVTGVAMRFKTDGQPLDQVGVSYVLHKSADGWKIAVVVVHAVIA
jgi:ketosteroid isomerase-like protein